jgi:hypothetical protein
MKVLKPGQISDDRKDAIRDELRAGCKVIGCRSVYSTPGKRVDMFSREVFGLCAGCVHCFFITTQYRILRAICDYSRAFPMALNESEPVTECTRFVKEGFEDANDHSKHAWILDPEEGKAGF